MEPPGGNQASRAATAGRSSPAAVEIATFMGIQSGLRQTWSEICSCGDYRGRWVALDGVRYDESTTRPAEGTVIDSDDDLAQLCARLRSANRRCCAILHCDDEQPAMPAFRGAARRAMAH